MICSECNEKCKPVWVDDSFDHEFGTETIKYIASDCCEADIVSDSGEPFTQKELEELMI